MAGFEEDKHPRDEDGRWKAAVGAAVGAAALSIGAYLLHRPSFMDPKALRAAHVAAKAAGKIIVHRGSPRHLAFTGGAASMRWRAR